jgi:hypothetical protein
LSMLFVWERKVFAVRNYQRELKLAERDILLEMQRQ